MTKKGLGANPFSVIGVDPGLAGAFVITDGAGFIEVHAMPVITEGKDKAVNFSMVNNLLGRIREKHGRIPVFLERAVSFGMGTKGAFNYGRGFEAVSIALSLHEYPLTLVEPGKWTKEMHEGSQADLKPKARSQIVVRRLFPQLVGKLPVRPRGGLMEGPMDALLIAGYGLRRLNPLLKVPPFDPKAVPDKNIVQIDIPRVDEEDFY